MNKNYLIYKPDTNKYFIEVYEPIKRTESQLQEYAGAIERLAKSGSGLVFDTQDYELTGTYEYTGSIYNLSGILGVVDSAKTGNEMIFKHDNRFRLPKNVSVVVNYYCEKHKYLTPVKNCFNEGDCEYKDYAQLEFIKEEKQVNISTQVLNDVIKYFQPITGNKNESEQKVTLNKLKKILNQ